MGALRAAQFEYDNRMPPAVIDDDADQVEWIEKHAAHLVLGYRVSWGYRGERGEITQADLARAVQDHANQRQIDGLDKQDAFGKLVMAGLGTGSAGFIKSFQPTSWAALARSRKSPPTCCVRLRQRPLLLNATRSETSRSADFENCRADACPGDRRGHVSAGPARQVPTPVPDQTFVFGMLEGFEKIGLFDLPTLNRIREKVVVNTTQRVEQLRESA